MEADWNSPDDDLASDNTVNIGFAKPHTSWPLEIGEISILLCF